MKSPIALKLLSTKIRKLHFEAIEEILAKSTVDLKISLGHSFDYRGKEKMLLVLITINIFGEEAPFKIEVEFEGKFILNRQATKKEIEPFAKVNCSAILFPYIRETIAEITRRAGFPPFHLDLINFVEFFKQECVKDAQQKKTKK